MRIAKHVYTASGRLFFAFAVTLTATSQVSAGPFYVRYTGGASAENTDFYNSGVLSQTSVSHSESTSSANAAATTSGTARLGSLSGVAHASATGSSSQPVGAEGSIIMEWGDYITATGPAEGDGFIHLHWTVTFNDTISSSGPNNANLTATQYAIADFGIDSLAPITMEDYLAIPYSGPRILTGDLLVTPGNSFLVNGVLRIDGRAIANTGPSPATVTGDADASFGAVFNLDPDPLTGGSYTTASGVDYFSSPVPEPSTFVLGIAGLAGLGFKALRKKRSLA